MCIITVFDTSSKCNLNTLGYVYVKARQTFEEQITVIKMTTDQGIYHQDGSLICEVLSNSPVVMQHCKLVMMKCHFLRVSKLKLAVTQLKSS